MDTTNKNDAVEISGDVNKIIDRAYSEKIIHSNRYHKQNIKNITNAISKMKSLYKSFNADMYGIVVDSVTSDLKWVDNIISSIDDTIFNNNTSEDIPTDISIDTPSGVFRYIHTVNDYLDNFESINRIYGKINSKKESYSTNLDSVVIDINNKIHKLLKKYTSLRNDILNILSGHVNYISHNITKSSVELPFDTFCARFDIITDSFLRYKKSDILYTSICKNILKSITINVAAAHKKKEIATSHSNNIFNSDTERHAENINNKKIYKDYMMMKIEEVKNRLVVKIGFDDKKSIRYNNPPVQTHSLVPITLGMPIKETLGRLLGKNITVSGTHKQTFLKYAKKVVFIVLYHIVQVPREHDISRMIDDNEGKYVQLPGTSISEKTIERHVTIQDVGKNKKIYKWDFSAEVYGVKPDYKKKDNMKKIESKRNTSSKTSPVKVYALETLNNETYRILVPVSSLVSSKKNIYELPRYVYEKLFRNIDNGYRSTDNSRVYNINRMETQIALENVFTDKFINTAKFLDEAKVEDYSFLRKSIYIDMMKLYDKKVGKKLLSKRGFYWVLCDDAFTEMLNDKYINGYIEYATKKSYKIGSAESDISEILASFMSGLNDRVRTFTRNMQDEFKNSEGVIDKLPTDSKGGIKNPDDVRRVMENILTNTLKKTINNATNVFQTMLRKHSMLME